MKKLLAATLCLTMVLAGCSKNSTQINQTKTVYTTITPITCFTKYIAGDKINVQQIAKDVDAHDFEPSAQDIAKLSTAEIVFYNGLDLDSFIEKVDVKKVNLSIILDNLVESDHSHDDHSDDDHDHDDDEVVAGHEHQSHDNKNYDPHVWLNPANVKEQLKLIKDELSVISPENAQYFEDNYNVYAQKCDELLAEFKSLSGLNVVTTHNAYAYWKNDFNINVVGMDAESNSEISPKVLKDIITYCKNNNISTIYYEEGSSDKNALAVANEIGAKVQALNAFESIKNDKDDYFEVMTQNIKALKQEQ